MKRNTRIHQANVDLFNSRGIFLRSEKEEKMTIMTRLKFQFCHKEQNDLKNKN